jgi:hypothetical protein
MNESIPQRNPTHAQDKNTYRGVLSQARQQGEATEFVDSVVGHVQLHQHLQERKITTTLHLKMNSGRQATERVRQECRAGKEVRCDILETCLRWDSRQKYNNHGQQTGHTTARNHDEPTSASAKPKP